MAKLALVCAVLNVVRLCVMFDCALCQGLHAKLGSLCSVVPCRAAW